MPAAEGFKLLVDSWLEYNKVKETEVTKRETIRAHRDIAIERIHAQKEMFQNIINKTFAERAKNFDHFFATLDKGIEEKNDQIINGAMQMIVSQMQESPLAGMNKLMAMINDPDVDAIQGHSVLLMVMSCNAFSRCSLNISIASMTLENPVKAARAMAVFRIAHII